MESDRAAGASPDARLLRVVHVSNAFCRCPPHTDLHAQAQAQPPHLSFEVVCVAHGVHPTSGAELLVLALSTNGLILRVKGSQPAGEPGDYFLEWPAAPGDAKDHEPFRITCMAISPDLRYLLCVTSAGNAYGFEVKRIVRASSRVYDEETTLQIQWASPLGPSLLSYSMEPKYNREGPQASTQELRARGIALGSRGVGAMDFDPKCCIWWVTKGGAPYVIVGGKGGHFTSSSMPTYTGFAVTPSPTHSLACGGLCGRGMGDIATVSVVDMAHEREVDLVQLSRVASASVTSLSLHPWVGGSRVLLMTLGEHQVYSLILEACAPLDVFAPMTPPRVPRPHSRSPSTDTTQSDSSSATGSPKVPRGTSSQAGRPPVLPPGVKTEEEAIRERSVGSLWHRCVVKDDTSGLVAPDTPQIFAWLLNTCELYKAPTGSPPDTDLLCVVGTGTGLQVGGPGRTSFSNAIVVGRLDRQSNSYMLELHGCGSPSSAPRCCRLSVASLEPFSTLLGTTVQQVVSAKAADEMLVLSCACSPDAPTAAATGAADPTYTYWLLLFHMPSDRPPTLFRVFRSPSAAPMSLLTWLPPAPPDWYDVLLLAQSRLRLPRRASVATPDDVLVSRIMAWSACTVSILRLLGQRDWQGKVVDLRHANADGPPPLRAPMEPGAVIAMLGHMAESGQRDCAISFGWTVLLGAPPEPRPALHPDYYKVLVDADRQLGQPEGKGELALRVARWMLDEPTTGDSGRNFRAFLALCQDYSLPDMVSVLLDVGRTSEALYASWVRGGLGAVEDTVRQLSRCGCLPLRREDVAWLCTQGAGRALVAADGSAFWASMPVELQLELVMAEDKLMLLPDQYEWLFTSIPQLPRGSLAALVFCLASWLSLMGDGDNAAPSSYGFFKEGTIAPALSSLRRTCLPSLMSKEPAHPVLAATAPHNEEEERRRDRELRLSQLLLLSLLAMAQPIAQTLLAVVVHGWAAEGEVKDRATCTLLQGLSATQLEALEAQLLLEGLVRVWTRRDVAPSAMSSSYNLRFTPALLLARALLVQNVGCAAVLLESAGRWRDGLELRLDEVMRAVRPADDRGQVAGMLLGLVRSHVLARPPGESFTVPRRRSMMRRVLDVWGQLGIPARALEEACAEQALGTWGWHMLTALLMDLYILSKERKSCKWPSFSRKFCIGLTHHVIEHGRAMEREGVTNLWSTGGMPNPVGHAESGKTMWDSFYELAQRMEREGDVEGSRMVVSTQDLAQAIARQESKTGSGDTDRRIYMFSCGHVLTRLEMHRAIGSLESRLTSLKRPLHLTAEVLSQEYRETSRAMRVACPSCVMSCLVEKTTEEEEESKQTEKQIESKGSNPAKQLASSLQWTSGGGPP